MIHTVGFNKVGGGLDFWIVTFERLNGQHLGPMLFMSLLFLLQYQTKYKKPIMFDQKITLDERMTTQMNEQMVKWKNTGMERVSLL